MAKNKGTSLDYSNKSNFWKRTDKKIQSDFLCRPYALAMLGDLAGKDIADIGCGEGYFSRLMYEKGPKSQIALDKAPGLICQAKAREQVAPKGIKYYVGDALDLSLIADASLDLIVSILVFNHFDQEQMVKAMNEVHRILKQEGIFLMAVAHPNFFLWQTSSKWYSLNYQRLNYWNDKEAEITLYTRDQGFDITAKIHTMTDYINSLVSCGFQIVAMAEPQATREDLEIFPEMWGEEDRIPTYLIIKVKKV